MSTYISLTTVPERLSTWPEFKQNVLSLINQKTDRDYKVVINIPKIYKNRNMPYIVPDELTQLAASNPKLIINRIDTDRGPIEKVIGCFNIVTDPEDVIITLDDDHVYYDDLIEYVSARMDKYPNTAIGFRGDNIVDKREFIDKNGIKKYILLGTHAFFPLKHDTYAAIPGHWHSVTYKRKFFGDDFFTDEYLGVADSDDLVVGYYLRKKKINFIMLAWDKENNFIPVNYSACGLGKHSHHYPILKQLSYATDTGFNLFRQKTGNHLGFVRKDLESVLKFDCDNWYYEPPFSEADEPKPEQAKVATPVAIPSDTKYPPGDAIPVAVDMNNFVWPVKPVITFTTVPTRLADTKPNGITKCIYSLLMQNYPGEYEIHFNVPFVCKSTGEKYEIPNWVLDLPNQFPRFKIFRTDDFGPITKLYPTLLRVKDPESFIVVVDDDLVYHEDMLKEQIINQFKFPNSAVGYDGLACWQPIYNDVRDHYLTAVRKHVKTKTLQHYKSISYKRKYFEDDLKQLMDEYYTWCDDSFVSAYLGFKGIKRVTTYHETLTPYYETVDDWQKGGGAITFPVLAHTSHEGAEGCNIFKNNNVAKYKKNIFTSQMIEKYIS